MEMQEREFNRRLLNILKTIGSYRLACKKIISLRGDPVEYMKSGSLVVPAEGPDKEEQALVEARDKLWDSLKEQAGNLAEPLEGILPDILPYDLTYTPSVTSEILDVVGEFVNAATVGSGDTAVVDNNYDLYEGDEDRF